MQNVWGRYASISSRLAVALANLSGIGPKYRLLNCGTWRVVENFSTCDPRFLHLDGYFIGASIYLRLIVAVDSPTNWSHARHYYY